MNCSFSDPELLRLFTEGVSQKFKVESEIAQKFVLRIRQMEAARDESDLRNIKSLKFKKERKAGLMDSYTIAVINNYKLQFEINLLDDSEEKILTITNLYQ